MFSALLLTAALSQTASGTFRVAVVDVSASDAIYEDLSRGLADDVVASLNAEGCLATRIDESLLPKGCRFGPCLEKVARMHLADAVVTLDARDEGKTKARVLLAAMRGTNGELLATAKYTVTPGESKVPKIVTAFSKKTHSALMPPDAH